MFVRVRRPQAPVVSVALEVGIAWVPAKDSRESDAHVSDHAARFFDWARNVGCSIRAAFKEGMLGQAELQQNNSGQRVVKIGEGSSIALCPLPGFMTPAIDGERKGQPNPA